jgi:hypothetical protein
MIQIALHRGFSWIIARSDVRPWELGDTSHGWQDKSPDIRLGHVVGWIEGFVHWGRGACRRCHRKVQQIQCQERRRPPFFCERQSP